MDIHSSGTTSSRPEFVPQVIGRVPGGANPSLNRVIFLALFKPWRRAGDICGTTEEAHEATIFDSFTAHIDSDPAALGRWLDMWLLC